MSQGYPLATLSLLLSATFAGLASPSIASTYRSQNEATVLVLNEANSSSSTQSGFYFTKSAGRSWMGDITINQVSAGASHVFYSGRFKDQTLGPGTRLACTGTVQIARQNVGVSDQIAAKATWKVTGGKGCPVVGKTITLDLVEPLPRPDRNGDFTPDNANTWMSATSGSVTWPVWRVVSTDGKLNCRTSPNGSIKKVYTGRDRVMAELRGNPLTLSGGAWWMLTRQGCYVRSNSQYLQPISIPE